MPLSLTQSGRKNRNTYTRTGSSSGKKKRKGAALRVLQILKGYAERADTTDRLVKVAMSVVLLTCLTLVLVGICYSSLWMYRKAVTSNFFTTRHVDVSGNVRLTRDMVLEYGGIREGENCLAVSIANVERNLRQTPWVEEVSVKRLLPDRFVIKLKERLPSFWVHRNGVLYYANERGEIIAPVESRNFLSLPTLRVAPGAEDDIPYVQRLMQGMQQGVLPVEISGMSSVNVSPGNGIEVYLEDREMRFSIATDDWDGNIARLSVTLGDLSRRHELRHVREVRSVNGNVWVLLNQPT